MGRPKTRGDLKTLNLNIKADIYDILSKHSENTGASKTFIVEKALLEYFEKKQKESKSID